MSQGSLLQVLDSYLASGDLQLPVYSPVAAKVQRVAADPRSNASELERTLLHDPALSSQILKVANSAFFAGLAKIDSVKSAIVRLGSDQVVQLAVAISQKAQFKAEDSRVTVLLTSLWRHSLGVGLGARWLASHCGMRANASEAFMAGLFHDIGKLVLLKALDDCCTSGRWKRPLTDELVGELLDTLHTEHGARLIDNWNLPSTFEHVARHHHEVELRDDDMLTRIVRLSDLACTKLGLNLSSDPDIMLSTTADAEFLGIDEVSLAELEIMLEDNVPKLAA